MSVIPKELRFNKSHEWVKVETGNIVTVGITDHAQSLLGDLVYIELPEVGQQFKVGEECCVVESVKAASDVYCPLEGTVVEINEDLSDTPEILNQEPYSNGWLFKLQLDNIGDVDNLIDAEEYEAMITEES